MRRLASIAPTVWLLALVAAAPHCDAAPVSSVLRRMDEGAPSFRGIAAKVSRVMFTAVIRESSEESGAIRLAKSKRDVRFLIAFSKPDVKSVAFSEKKLEIFYPKINTVQEWDLSKHKSLVNQMLLLGFGSTGRELSKNYSVSGGEEETVGGVKASRLELLPKSSEARQHISKVELWIADPGGYPVKQKLYTPSGDTTTVTYSDIKINPSFGPSDLTLAVPKEVKREFPQK